MSSTPTANPKQPIDAPADKLTRPARSGVRGLRMCCAGARSAVGLNWGAIIGRFWATSSTSSPFEAAGLSGVKVPSATSGDCKSLVRIEVVLSSVMFQGVEIARLRPELNEFITGRRAKVPPLDLSQLSRPLPAPQWTDFEPEPPRTFGHGPVPRRHPRRPG